MAAAFQSEITTTLLALHGPHMATHINHRQCDRQILAFSFLASGKKKLANQLLFHGNCSNGCWGKTFHPQ